jgi:hypothetical protein
MTLALGLAVAAMAGCKARKRYPDPAIGWHSPDYGVVYGRLFRVPLPAPSPGAEAPPPAWVLKFGEAGESYAGEIALTPPERLVGYSGGEAVEVRGHFMKGATNDPYNGKWYVVDSIRMWYGHR